MPQASLAHDLRPDGARAEQRDDDVASLLRSYRYEALFIEGDDHLQGAPLRLRVENRLGFKMVMWIEAIEFVEDVTSINRSEGGYNEDHEYFGELANI
jgi:hypothetical protein